jgi:hypothetical protein
MKIFVLQTVFLSLNIITQKRGTESHCYIAFSFTYFPKIKVGLSNNQSVCLFMCPPQIAFEPLGRFP